MSVPSVYGVVLALLPPVGMEFVEVCASTRPPSIAKPAAQAASFRCDM